MRPYQEIETLLEAFESWQSGIYAQEATRYHFAGDFPGRKTFSPPGGLERCINWIDALSFLPEEIQHLGSLQTPAGSPLFNESFLNYLQRFDFSCDMDVFPLGLPAYSEELLLRIRGPLIQLQIVKPGLERWLGGVLEEGKDPAHSFLLPVYKSGKLVHTAKTR